MNKYDVTFLIMLGGDAAFIYALRKARQTNKLLREANRRWQARDESMQAERRYWKEAYFTYRYTGESLDE